MGARRRDITVQFLIEAVLLTTVGGVIGMALGIGVSMLADAFSPLPAVIAWWSPVLAFTVSVAVGVFFGVIPAVAPAGSSRSSHCAPSSDELLDLARRPM